MSSLELIAPTVRLSNAWRQCHAEWGPGRHEDGFGLWSDDEVQSQAGFAAFVSRLAAPHEPPSDYRWIVRDGQVLGGIVLRLGESEYVRDLGHVGYGVRPSARRRGLASWALGRMLERARDSGLDRALLVCAADNLASARTIQRCGGVFEEIREIELGRTRRYWVTLR
ncbi:MAG TPA: GNAT family N-acetyltransferase [Pseudonocardiaceae bacterium]|jgi:predicted acetyltransferase|nr:GNAT family N-acetyltransferase [Pseudonocardiaceae bacterium]